MFYSVHSKKGRDRPCMLKKFQNAQNKVSNMPNCKPETVLRILRSYRICLLHEYCHTLLRDVYLETIKLQTVQVCNDLRIKSQLFPKAKHRRDRLFKVQFGEEMERLSYNQS